jgi:hypothetical protein
MAEAAAVLQAQINVAVVAALAAQAAAAVPAQVAHVAVKLPEFWVKDPKMWFSQAEAQFRRARITAETTMYDYVLLGSYGMTKWQMAYSLLDHPDLGDRRPSAMMAEMLSLRFQTTAPDSLFLALFLRRLPASIRDHLAAANHTTATEMATHADILWDARSTTSVSAVTDSLVAVSVRSASPNRCTKSPDRRARSPVRRGHRRGGGRQPPRRPTPGRPDGKNICWTHKKYGVDATNCRPGCEWAEN